MGARRRIGLLEFGPNERGFREVAELQATHPDDSPSTTKHTNRCELDGVDRITGQAAHRFNASGVTNNPLSQLASLRLGRVSFEWDLGLFL